MNTTPRTPRKTPRLTLTISLIAAVAIAGTATTIITHTTLATASDAATQTQAPTPTAPTTYCEAAEDLARAARTKAPKKTTAATIQRGLNQLSDLYAATAATATASQGSTDWRMLAQAYKTTNRYYTKSHDKVADDTFIYLLAETVQAQNTIVSRWAPSTKANCGVDLTPLIVHNNTATPSATPTHAP